MTPLHLVLLVRSLVLLVLREILMTHPMRRFTEIRPVVVEGHPDAHNVYLKITNQEFCITKYACDTREEAEWMRDQLCFALARVVSEERTP